MPAFAINRWKREITDEESIFSVHIINKRLVSLNKKSPINQ